MPQHRLGNMLEIAKHGDGNAWICVTTNSYITKDGRLVMGKGFAKQIRDEFPGIDKVAGDSVKHSCGHLGEYLLCPLLYWDKRVILFQVKYNFRDEANLKLIEKSTYRLKAVAECLPTINFHLNFPGIGNGRLNYSQVAPIIDMLPSNVYVWQLHE